VPVGQLSVSVTEETTILQLAVAVLPCESTTWAVKLYVPAVVGVPVIAPVDGFSVKPGGRKPLINENVYGATPPVATRAELYAVPTCAVPVGQVRVIASEETTILQLVMAVLPCESMTWAVKL
jgi:hypothetical protein